MSNPTPRTDHSLWRLKETFHKDLDYFEEFL